LKKQAFSLIDGRCLDVEGVGIPIYDTRLTPDGTVLVANSPKLSFEREERSA
jgi:nitrite reductase (NADH) small subunit